nr:hypothetical protein [Tanacetum cinerariifolium]
MSNDDIVTYGLHGLSDKYDQVAVNTPPTDGLIGPVSTHPQNVSYAQMIAIVQAQIEFLTQFHSLVTQAPLERPSQLLVNTRPIDGLIGLVPTRP